ncbi:exported hypothetical protein [Klebsiella variicola]|nr:exported hypothetical protein [Klebsiella variicola]
MLISPTQPHRPRRRHLPAVFLSVGGCAPAGRIAHWSPVNRHGCLMSSLKFSITRQEALLIMITMFWGGTFLAVQYAVSLSGPLFFVGLRFATAALAVGLLSLRTLRGLTWLEVKAGGRLAWRLRWGMACRPGDCSRSPVVNLPLSRRCMCRWYRCCSGCAWAVCRG